MRRLILVLAFGCGGGDGTDAPDGAVDRDAAGRDSAPGDDAPTERPFVPLVNRAWTASAVSEGFHCAGAQLTEDLWIAGFRPAAATGTYNLLLTATDTPQPDGAFECDATGVGEQLVFTSGRGTGDLVFPEGTAMRVAAGKYLRLTIHTVNFDASPISGESGIDIQTIPAAEVSEQAEAFFTGNFNGLNTVPGDSQPHPVAASCTVPVAWRVIALMPRMHQYGTAIAVRRLGFDGTVSTFVDAAFSHDDVQIHLIGQSLAPNDMLDATCTYVNTSGGPVGFGESYTAEECLIATYVAPAEGVTTFFCTSNN